MRNSFQNSGSASGSCSQTDSSDSDSSSSSQESSSRSPSPEFSVTSTQANSLRLTIAAVRKSCSSPITEKVGKTYTELKPNSKQQIPTKNGNLSSSSDSPCSRSDSGESNTDSEEADSKKFVKKSVSGMMRNRTRAMVDKKNEKSVSKAAASPKIANRVKQRQKRKKVR